MTTSVQTRMTLLESPMVWSPTHNTVDTVGMKFKNEWTLESTEMSVTLRALTIEDSYLLKNWDLDEDVGYSGGDDDSYDWDYELPRNVDWREFLIAEVDAVPIGMIVLIDALREESHYWGQDAPVDSWAIDIWIGGQEHRSKGYGASMMKQALQRCFADHGASSVLIDPLQTNHRAIEFYRRVGFKEVGPRRFGSDDCLVMSITHDVFEN